MSRFDSKRFKHWPNFIVIGPGKSGTTWLYQILGAHPQICTSSAKETVFFDSEYHRGLKWYAKFFRQCESAAETHAVGEISNTYIFSPQVPGRIKQDFPAMKLISTLRNPIERAFSHYLFERRNAAVNGTFEEALLQRPDFLERGCYNQHLTPYYDQFPKNQIQVLVFDDLKSDNQAYADQLFQFLNVGPLPDESILGKRVLGASEARSRVAAKVSVGVARAVRAAGFPEIVTKIKNSFVAKMLFKPIDRNHYPAMLPETELRLKDYFRSDIEALSNRLDRNFVELWLEPKATSPTLENVA